MKNLILILVSAIGIPYAAAADSSYQCLIKDHLILQINGTVKKPSQPYLIGQRFAIDRITGRLTGPVTPFSFVDSDYSVVAYGNGQSSFVSTIKTVAAGNGVHFATVRVEEFADGKEKPFVILDGGTIASGICE